MSTLTTTDVKTQTQKRELAANRPVCRIGRLVLTILGTLLALLSLLPVAALPFLTAVPLPLFGLLALADVGLLALLLRGKYPLYPQSNIVNIHKRTLCRTAPVMLQ